MRALVVVLLAALPVSLPVAAAAHAWSGTRPIELDAHEPARLALVLVGALLGVVLRSAWSLWRRGRGDASLRSAWE